MKQREVAELLARADDLAVQNKSYQEVYAAMAQSLSEAWVDLNKQLDYRKLLLDQSINFHESALQVRDAVSQGVLWMHEYFKQCSDRYLKVKSYVTCMFVLLTVL